jgi:hypothetical protein
MKYRFEHKIFYKDEKIEAINTLMHNFGFEGDISLAGHLGHTDIIFDIKDGQEFRPLSGEQNETIRAELEKVINEKIKESIRGETIDFKVKVAEGKLVG